MLQSKSLSIRMTDEEFEAITNKAKSYGISTSEYIRLVALNAQISVKVKALK